jgi:predicted RNA-binding Zn-ribbon protein involved in translation (DUF1610 family)
MQDTTTTEAVCYRHPGRETRVSCSSCGRPICPDCMVDTPVGFKCPECARLPRSAVVRLRPDRAFRAIAAAFAGGLAMGFGIVVLQGVGLFFALILGWLIGIGMGELVLWASGRYRGRETALIALGGCIWTYVVPYGLFYGVDLGDVARSGSLVFVFIGAVIACYVAYNRVQ